MKDFYRKVIENNNDLSFILNIIEKHTNNCEEFRKDIKNFLYY